jgi:hypothetical protein
MTFISFLFESKKNIKWFIAVSIQGVQQYQREVPSTTPQRNVNTVNEIVKNDLAMLRRKCQFKLNIFYFAK